MNKDRSLYPCILSPDGFCALNNHNQHRCSICHLFVDFATFLNSNAIILKQTDKPPHCFTARACVVSRRKPDLVIYQGQFDFYPGRLHPPEVMIPRFHQYLQL